jgi:hypothetical protein
MKTNEKGFIYIVIGVLILVGGIIAIGHLVGFEEKTKMCEEYKESGVIKVGSVEISCESFLEDWELDLVYGMHRKG